MDKEILINAGAGEIRVALVEDGKLQELFLERVIGLEDGVRHSYQWFLDHYAAAREAA